MDPKKRRAEPRRKNAKASNAGDGIPGLTPREIEILKLLAKGRSNREVAEVLTISEQTVKNHVSTLLGKLQLRNRVELALLVTSQARLFGLDD
jgi:DNA-binding NarL/FixJ family response regulator